MQIETDVRLQRGTRRGLHEGIQVRRKQHWSFWSIAPKSLTLVARRLQPFSYGRVTRFGAESEICLVAGIFEPFPRLCECLPVNRIAIIRLRHRPGDHDASFRVRAELMQVANPVQPSKSLQKSINAGTLRYDGIKVQIRADFEALRGHYEHWFAILCPRIAGQHGVQVRRQRHAVDWPHAPDQQVRAAVSLPQRCICETRRPHAIHHHRDAPQTRLGRKASSFIHQVLREFAEVLGPRLAHDQARGLGRVQPFMHLGMLEVRVLQSERLVGPRHGCSRHLDKRERAVQILPRPGSPPILVNRRQGLGERPRTVGFVQKNQRIVRHQAGVNRQGLVRDAISTKQQARSDLVDRTRD